MANGFLLRSHGFTSAAFSTPAAGTSAAFVANDFMGMVLRANSNTAPAAALLDFGFVRPVDTVAVLEAVCRTSAALGISVAVGNDPTFASFIEQIDLTPAATETPTLSGRGVGVGFFSTTHFCRYALVQVRSDNTFAPEFARAVIGTRLQPGRNFSFGVGRGVNDLGTVEFAPRGAFLRRNAARRRTLGLSWQYLTEIEAEQQALPLLEAVGTTEALFACLDPDPDPSRIRRCYFGPLQGNPALSWRGRDRWEKRLQIVSLI